jgi:hypothetical protein
LQAPITYYLPGLYSAHLHITTIEKRIQARTGFNPRAQEAVGGCAVFAEIPPPRGSTLYQDLTSEPDMVS